MHYCKVASENPSNETAVPKFFTGFSKVIPVTGIFGGARKWCQAPESEQSVL